MPGPTRDPFEASPPVTGSGGPQGPPGRLSWTMWGGLFVLLVLATVAFEWMLIAPNEADRASAAWRSRLSDASADRAGAVAQLVAHRAEDLAVIARLPATVALLAIEPARRPADVAAVARATDVLASFTETHDFRAASIYDAEWNLAATWPGGAAPNARVATLAREAAERPGTTLSALEGLDGSAEVLIARSSNGTTIVLVSDAAKLFGIVAGAHDDAIERSVVAADGDRLIRAALHRTSRGESPARVSVTSLAAAPPGLRAALDAASAPVGVGVADGEPARLSLHRVEGTPWCVVAEIDDVAASAELAAATSTRRRLGGLALLAVGALGFAIIRWQRASQVAALLRSDARFAALIDRANDAVLVVDDAGTIVRANERAGSFYRTSPQLLVGRTVFDLRRPEDRVEARAVLERCHAGDGAIFGAVHVRADGTLVPVEVSARSILSDGEKRLLAIVRDATPRRAAEARVASLTRFLRALASVKDVILAHREPALLFQGACDAIVDRTGIAAACIRALPESVGAPVVAAAAGRGRDSVAALADAMRAAGVAPETAGDPTPGSDGEARLAKFCAETAPAFGVGAVSVAPLRCGATVVGWLQLQDSDARAFDGEVADVVRELAKDLGLALLAIDERRSHDAERARADAEILASAARERDRAAELAAVLDAVPAGVWYSEDTGATRIRGNRSAAEMLGVPHDAVISAADLSADPAANPIRSADGRPLTFDEMPMVLAARQRRRIDGVELEFVRPDGSRIRALGNAAPILDADGAPRGAVGSFIDVTSERNASARLRVLSRAIEQNSASVVITDPQGVIQYVNPKFEKLTGYSLDEAVGRTPRLLKSGETAARVYEDLWRTITSGREWRGELHNRRKDGTTYFEDAVIMPIFGDDGRIIHFVAVKEDISQRKQAEAALDDAHRKLVQAQKMEAVGRLAGGIAHDFNNILGVILGYAELSLARVPEGDPLRRNLQEICDASDRAASLTGQLLAFTRQQAAESAVVDVARSARDVAGMVRRLIGEDVELELVTAEGTGRVMVGRGHLDQMVLNLVVNARDAMPCGGKLTVTTRPVDCEPGGRVPQARRPEPGDELPAGRYALLSVSDTGTGIPPEAREHIFEPFFTTKEPGKGSGLGLASLWGLVSQSGGHVRYTTELGKGTAFRIYLPRVEDPEPADRAPEAPGRRGRGESVLVVEDDDSVRSLVQRLVSAAGYDVVAVSGIDGAQEAVARPGAAFDVVLADVVMPKMGGPQIVRVLRDRMPALRAVFMSGYTELVSSQQGEFPPGSAFLQKPFTVAKLQRTIREAIDASA